jgi:hypothetical protein
VFYAMPCHLVINELLSKIYRGGPEFKLRTIDYEEDAQGLVKLTKGLSLNTDPLDCCLWLTTVGRIESLPFLMIYK